MRGFLVLGMAAALLALPAGAAEPAPAGSGAIEQANALINSDPKKALEIMRQAAATGDPEAVNGLASFRQLGVGAPADLTEALALYDKAAAGGSEAAAANLGRLLLEDADKGNDARAAELLIPLAEHETLGPAVAYPLGRIKLLGLGGREQDIDGGLKLMAGAESREPDNSDLQFLLARAYQNGWGTWPQDPVKAARYFKRAAELGDRRAQWQYGMALLNGEGVRMDAREAWTWVRKSGEAGYVDGQISTAVMLAVGQGVQENDVEARDWYRKAAEQGSAHALRGLGFMLLTGEGGPIDPVTGQAYVEMAREGGDESAGPLLDELGKTLSLEDRRKAEAIKIDWKRKHGDPR